MGSDVYYTIRTTDGNRYDWFPPNGEDLMSEINDGGMKHVKFVGLPFVGGTKYFNVDHIVSITEHRED